MRLNRIQVAESRYDLEQTQQGLLVTDTQTGQQQIATLVKKQKNSKEGRYLLPAFLMSTL